MGPKGAAIEVVEWVIWEIIRASIRVVWEIIDVTSIWIYLILQIDTFTIFLRRKKKESVVSREPMHPNQTTLRESNFLHNLCN